MFKKINPRLISCLLVILFIVSCLTLPAAADTDQNKAQISVTASNKNPQIGDVITVTVSIDNCATMSPRISAMYISVSFDTNCFEYVSSESVLKTNVGDITSIHYDESDTVSFAYVYANSNKKTLPATAKNIFTFKLRVRMSLEAKTKTTFAVNDLEIYNGREENRISSIECKEPHVDTVTAWPKRPDILLNGSEECAAVYTEDVTLSFDATNVTLSYEGRPAAIISSPYNCSENGKYTVTVTKSNGQKIVRSFEINKEISNISVKPDTYKTDYALGITPDYSGWILLVNYRDGSHSEIQMDDPDVTITGYQPNVPGSQRLLIKYRGQSTSVTVTVTTKSVESVTIKSNIQKTEYLVGDDINTMGGVLLVFYDDHTNEDVPITAGMLSGYDKTYVGEQTVTVTYGTFSQFFNITYYSREAVDALNLKLSELDLSAITLESKPLIESLKSDYAELSKLQQDAVMKSKLEEAISIYNGLVKEANAQSKDTKEPESSTEPVKTEEEPKERDLKIVWYIVAGIVIVSVIGGIIYFLAIYFKKKKELDDDDYYYDDEDDEDDGSLTYDDDIDEIEDEEEEEEETAAEEEDTDDE